MKLSEKLFCLGLFIAVCAASGCHRFQAERLIHLGERYEGVLRLSDSVRAEPPRGPERRWVFNGQAGQRVTIAAESYEFNIYLLLVSPQGRQIAWSDDSEGFFNARIHTTLPTTGRYTVIVCGADADQYGTYWLSLGKGDGGGTDLRLHPLSYYREGIEWAERQKSQRAVSWLNLAMGQYFRRRRQWERAEEHYAKSLAAAEETGSLYGQWAVALERGRLLTRRMRYDQAIGELQRALALSKKLRAVDETEALVWIQLGDLYHSTERADLAQVHYRKATEGAERSGLPSALARLYTSLNAFLRRRDKGRAVEYAQKAYALHPGLDPVLEMRAAFALASTYLFLMSGRAKEGFKLAAEARRMAQRLGCLDDEVSILTMMSMGYYMSNNIEEMISSARQAAELTSSDDEDPNPRRIALQLQASGEMARGNYETALRLCLKAMKVLDDAWSRESVEELRQEFLSQSRAISSQIIMNLYALNARHPSREYARQAFDFAERSRSRSLLD